MPLRANEIFKVKTTKLTKKQEDASYQVVSDFSFSCDWLRVVQVFWTNHRAK